MSAKIDLYTWGTPNGHKISIFLEETEIPYNVVPVNISNGEQFKQEFLAVSPNSKIPAIVYRDVPGEPISIFESGAILVYLAEKYGKFLPTEPSKKAKVLQWVFWQAGGLGPNLGQYGHFAKFAKEKIPYAIERFQSESLRLIGVFDKELATKKFIAGDEYTIADMMSFPWLRVAYTFGFADNLEVLAPFKNVKRYVDEIAQRPAVQKGLNVPAK